MKTWFRKLAPFLAIVGLAALIFAYVRGKKSGDIMASIKGLFQS